MHSSADRDQVNICIHTWPGSRVSLCWNHSLLFHSSTDYVYELPRVIKDSREPNDERSAVVIGVTSSSGPSRVWGLRRSDESGFTLGCRSTHRIPAMARSRTAADDAATAAAKGAAARAAAPRTHRTAHAALRVGPFAEAPSWACVGRRYL